MVAHCLWLLLQEGRFAGVWGGSGTTHGRGEGGTQARTGQGQASHWCWTEEEEGVRPGRKEDARPKVTPAGPGARIGPRALPMTGAPTFVPTWNQRQGQRARRRRPGRAWQSPSPPAPPRWCPPAPPPSIFPPPPIPIPTQGRWQDETRRWQNRRHGAGWRRVGVGGGGCLFILLIFFKYFIFVPTSELKIFHK